MDAGELANYNGCDGRPAYVAVSGIIYDVSESRRWKHGNHEGIHQAGQDLTEALKTAPHVRVLIERFPLVGKLEKTAPTPVDKKFPLVVIIAGILLLLALAALLI